MMRSTNANFKYPRGVTRACAEVIIIVTDVSKRPPADCDMAGVHESICKKFDTVIKLCRVNSLPDDAALELLYPLAALVDETVMSIPQHRFFWSECPLQLRYFGEITAGTKFFSRLETRMKASGPNADVLEMYFIGLALGLKGMHGARDPRRCVQIFENLGIMLKKMRRPAPRQPILTDRCSRGLSVLDRRFIYPAITLLMIAAAAAFHVISRTNLLNFLDRGAVN